MLPNTTMIISWRSNSRASNGGREEEEEGGEEGGGEGREEGRVAPGGWRAGVSLGRA